MKGFVFLSLLLSSFSTKADLYQLFEENGKKGIKNEKGQVLIPPSFEALGWSDGNFSVISEVTGYRINKKWGLINLKKELITPALFLDLTYAGGEYIVARKQISPAFSKVGCVNLKGETKIPFAYDGIEITGLRAIVFNLAGAKFTYGLTDLQNQVLIPIQYRNIFSLGTLRFAVENREGKIALFDDRGKPVTDFNIDSLSKFYKGYSIVFENGLQGLIDRDGIIKLPVQYQAIKIDPEGLVFAKLPGEWIYLNSQNEPQSNFFADDLFQLSDAYFLARRGEKYGVMSIQHKWLIPASYDSLSGFSGDRFYARVKAKWGVITERNEIQVPINYNSIDAYELGFRANVNNNGWHLLDLNGKPKTQKAYQDIASYNGATWKVQSGIYWGLLNKNGEEKVHCVFDSIGDRTANLVAVKFKGQYGIIDLQENWVVAPQPFPIRLANDTRYLLVKPGNSFLKSIDGKIIYFSSYPVQFKENYWVELLADGSENAISYDGLKIDRQEHNPEEATIRNENRPRKFQFREGLKGIKKDDKFGFVDLSGKLLIPNRYDSIRDFYEGLAPIKLIGKWGFINTSDKIVIQPNFDSVSDFVNGLSIVKRNGKAGLITKTGSFILPLRYTRVVLQRNNKFLLSINNLVGMADAKGIIELEPRFDFLQDLNNGFLIARSGGKFGLITAQGLDKIPMVYDKLLFEESKNLYIALKKGEWKQMSIQ